MDIKAVLEDVAKELNLNLKSKQTGTVLHFYSGNNVFVSLPTGFSKSIIYGILPLVSDRMKGIITSLLSNSKGG